MILVVADDLLFRSKISTAAKALGVVVRAATTEEVRFEAGMSGSSSHSEWYSPLFCGFVDRVPLQQGLLPALLVATVTTVVVVLLAALRHTRRALALRPIEALG